MVATAPHQPYRWLQPRFVVLFVGFAPLLLSAAISRSSYVVLYGTDKYLGTDFVVAGGLVLLAFLLGAGYQRQPQHASFEDALVFGARFQRSLLAIAILGYVLWFAWAAWNHEPERLLRALNQLVIHRQRGAADFLRRDLLTTPPGITSLTHVGVVGLMMQSALRASRRRALLATGSTVMAVTLLSLIIFRSTFLSERLSLIETVVPIIVVFAIVRSVNRTGSTSEHSLRLIPPVFAAGVVGLFAFAEYFRSWAYYQHHFDGSFTQFIVQRLLGYYATALNNGALMAEHAHLWVPLEHTFNVLRRIPSVGSFFFDEPAGDWHALLFSHANPEFNNPSGLGLWLQDFGLVGAMLFAAVAGLLMSMLLTRAAEGGPLALYAFPLLFTGLLEIPRVYYWVDTRAAPMYLALLLAWGMYASRRASHDAADGRAALPSLPAGPPSRSPIPPESRTPRDEPHRCLDRSGRPTAGRSSFAGLTKSTLHVVFASHTGWDSDFRVGSHQLAAAFARRGHEVLHMAAPRFSPFARRSASDDPQRDPATGVWTWRPSSLLPGRLLGRDDWLRYAVQPPLADTLSAIGFEQADILYIDYLPLSFLAEVLQSAPTIYRPTDLYGVGYRSSPKTRRMEQRLLTGGGQLDGVVATSAPVAERMLAIAPDVPMLVLRNGVDIAHFTTPRAEPQPYRSIPPPRALYVGALDERFDAELVSTAARAHPDIAFVLAGPPAQELSLPHPNMHYLGPIPYADVPALMQHADVGLLPLSDDPANAGRSPMKLHEYLAAGLRVVATHPAELATRRTVGLTLTSGPDEFAHAVADAVRQGRPPHSCALARRDWSNIAYQLEAFTRLVGRGSGES